MGRVATLEPRLLRKEQAAAYCGLSATVFEGKCSVAPKRLYDGAGGLRWDRFDLDRWIDSLGSGARPTTAEEWLERLGSGEGARERH